MKKFITIIVLLGIMQISKSQSLESVTYMDGAKELNGLVTANAGGQFPGVLIIPAWKGIDNEARTAALNLEKEGYIAFIADIYGKENLPVDDASAAKMAGFYRNNHLEYQHRVALALEELKRQGALEGKIAIIGYCFGGTGALEAARAGFDVQGIVSIHGGIAKDANRPNVPIKTKVLVEHPANDKTVTREDLDNLIKEMDEGKTDWQMVVYAHSGHTFTNPESPDYNEIMANRAWKHTLLFLEEVLK